jgi:hypothetical protein
MSTGAMIRMKMNAPPPMAARITNRLTSTSLCTLLVQAGNVPRERPQPHPAGAAGHGGLAPSGRFRPLLPARKIRIVVFFHWGEFIMKKPAARILGICLLLLLSIAPALGVLPLPPEDLDGEGLRIWLKDNWYTPYHTTLGYDTARMYMYNFVDNHGDLITCVYGGLQVAWTYGGSGTNPAPLNCEHTIPQSFFGSNEPMRSDLYHLFPTFDQWNSIRSNYPFTDIADTSTQDWMIGTTLTHTIPVSNIDAYSEAIGSAFEPREDHKGNVARAVFYFFSVYPSYNLGQVGDLETFLLWHQLDPVDAAEIARNDAIELYQGNRNPYVDHPDWVNRAWGSVSGDLYPQITGVSSAPYVPTPAESLTVTATATDDVGLSGVEIRYNVNGEAQSPVAMAPTGSPNQFAGQIPPAADGDLVEYFVAATDSSGQTAMSATGGVFWGTTPIANLHGVDDAGILEHKDYWARIEASITVAPGAFSTSNTQIFVQDDSAGICVYKQSSVVSGAVGDRIRAVGPVIQYNGLAELDIKPTGASFTNLGAGTPVEPTPLTLDQLDEAHEGLLVEVYGVELNAGSTFPPAGSNGFDLPITDFWNHPGLMDVDRDTNIDGSPTPTAPFTLVGVVTQFDASVPHLSSYKVVPRSQADIIRYTPGDLDTDGGITLADLVILLQHLGGALPAGTDPFEALAAAADVDASGAVNAADAVLLAGYLAGN